MTKPAPRSSPSESDGFGDSRLYVSSSMMEESPSYGEWIAEGLGRDLRGHVLELGCGSGVYTAHYLELAGVERVTAMDPDEDSLHQARARLSDPRVRFLVGSADDLGQDEFDAIVCANVAEHVEDEGPFFDALCRALRPGGALSLLVPAHPFLYSRYDHEAGHFRRYTKATLRRSLASSGLRLERLFYFNALGAVGWFYAFKLRQRRVVREDDSRSMIRLFERIVLPVGRALERVVSPPFGLSVVAICTKPE